ncbi:MAG TPA: hypothetical protein VJL36_01665 [Candidatus Paceibacterota bacterium]
MIRKISAQRGFIGLLGLLIAVMVIAFLSVKILSKMYALPAVSNQGDLISPSNSSPQIPTRSILDQAADAARAIENRSRGE